ncbi:hypothetical protein HY988_05140 [Candidatus Micrarchaeota archaeon]|nr:hypothetical protein [Candidatus Micrarchaeota archaeon]
MVKEIGMEKETERQLFHIGVGLLALLLLLSHGRTFMIAAVFFIIIFGTIFINLKLLGKKVPIIDWFEEKFEREHIRLPGWGSACYAMGVLIPLVFLNDISKISAVIMILAVGDGLSTLVGKRGKMKIPYNQNKTIEGSLAMFACSLVSYYFVGWLAIPLSILAAIVESMPLVDDNLSIPIACTIALMLIR